MDKAGYRTTTSLTPEWRFAEYKLKDPEGNTLDINEEGWKV